MILADTLKLLTTQTPTGLSQILKHSGYTGCVFKTARFLGITNGGQFCYHVTFHDEEGMDEDAEGKVFLTYDHVEGKVTADY